MAFRMNNFARVLQCRTKHPPSKLLPSSSKEASAVVTTSALGILLATAATTAALLDPQFSYSQDDDDEDLPPLDFQLEVNFMDKLARKPYMRQHDAIRDDASSGSSSSSSQHEQPAQRPSAVPPTLRLLTVNVPQVARQGFKNGACRLALDRAYPDSVVPPRRVVHIMEEEEEYDNDSEHEENEDTRHHKKKKKKHARKRMKTLEVEQKAWVQNLYRCYHDDGDVLGAEIMEADTLRLNPRRLVKHHHRRALRTSSPRQNHHSTSNHRRRDSHDENTHEYSDSSSSSSSSQLSVQDELDAPWHQTAWVSELQLRLRGEVEFGAELEPVPVRRPWWGWWFHSNNNNNHHYYHATVPSQRRLRDYLFFPYYGTAWPDPAGRDGSNLCWRSQQPHAVLADAAALQSASPQALRWLQKACHDHGVPLYVVGRHLENRVSGSGGGAAWSVNNKHNATHNNNKYNKSIEQALRDMRRHLKAKIIREQLELQQGSAEFRRGRWLGRLETLAQWQAADAARAARDLVHKLEQAAQRRRRERDWRSRTAAELERELVRRGVVTVTTTTAPPHNGAAITASNIDQAQQQSKHQHYSYSEAFQALLAKYAADQGLVGVDDGSKQEKKEEEDATTPATADDDDV